MERKKVKKSEKLKSKISELKSKIEKYSKVLEERKKLYFVSVKKMNAFEKDLKFLEKDYIVAVSEEKNITIRTAKKKFEEREWKGLRGFFPLTRGIFWKNVPNGIIHLNLKGVK